MKKFISVMMSLAMVTTCASVMANSLPTPVGITATKNMFNAILGFIQAISYAFALGMLLFVGIKYVMASANEKADLKKGSISYVIGAIIIFGAGTLCGVFQNLAGEVAKQ